MRMALLPAHHSVADVAAAREVSRQVGLWWQTELPKWLRLNLDVGPLLDQGLAQLAATMLWGAANREPSQLMWQLAGGVLQCGWLQSRAREKPRGYAGDHEMLGAIFRQQVTKNPLGISFDQYFLRQAAPQAVRNRMDLVSARVLRTQGKIVSIGSGVGLELVAALQKLSRADREQAEFWLLDLDPAAIVLAGENLRALVSQQDLHCLAENLVRLPKKRQLVEQLQNASLLICTGFFDYLEDGPAADLLKCFWQLLRPGGEALVFNFAPWNSSRAYMEWIGNWYLVYRTRADLARLANEAGVPTKHFEVTAEVSGINLLLRMVKPQ